MSHISTNATTIYGVYMVNVGDIWLIRLIMAIILSGNDSYYSFRTGKWPSRNSGLSMKDGDSPSFLYLYQEVFQEYTEVPSIPDAPCMECLATCWVTFDVNVGKSSMEHLGISHKYDWGYCYI